MWRSYRTLLAAAAGGLIFAGSGAVLAASPTAGATLQAYKTIDICDALDGTWTYSGVVSVWNEGTTTATTGLRIYDCIQNKVSGPTFTDQYCGELVVPIGSVVIPAGTTFGTATTFNYSFAGAPLPGTIRNDAKVTITNHSAHIGTPYGPEPKATWVGVPPPCAALPPGGCTYTQGYWGSKPNVTWPNGFDRNATFFYSGQTWQQVLDTPGGNGYYQLADQYIAAVLNQANGAAVPSGVQDTLNLALAWLDDPTHTPSTCSAGGSCGQQKDWAATLAEYNEGLYPGGPLHCGDE